MWSVRDVESCSQQKDGMRATDTIYLEPEVIRALEEYLKESKALPCKRQLGRAVYCFECLCGKHLVVSPPAVGTGVPNPMWRIKVQL
jgi:hypothetical protein